MLRIGQLATYVGVSTRTVRFYHQSGLLPEPERTSSGYRLYGPDDVLRLSRIVALASAGVPLARVHDLIDASDETFTAALTEIDADLRHRIRELKDDRERLRRLRAGDALTLPDVIVRHIAQLRTADVDQSLVDHYRDSWVLTHALYAKQLDPWMREFGERMYSDPRYVELMTRMFRIADLEPDDPQVTQLATDMATWMVDDWHAHPKSWEFSYEMVDPIANELLNAQWDHRPAWIRVSELIAEDKRLQDVP